MAFRKIGVDMKLPTFVSSESESSDDEADTTEEIELKDAIENLADNIIEPKSIPEFTRDLLEMDLQDSIIMSQDTWREIKRLSHFMGRKVKRQFARYLGVGEQTYECTINYYLSDDGYFYKIFDYGECQETIHASSKPAPKNVIIAKILTEIFFQKKARAISSTCNDEARFSVPEILEFGNIINANPSKESYYIKMEYINPRHIIKLTDILNANGLYAARLCESVIIKLKAAEACLNRNGIWHNDLSTPDNIFVYDDAGKLGIYIIDFGEASGMLGSSTKIFGPTLPSCSSMHDYSKKQAMLETQKFHGRTGGKTSRIKKRKSKRKSITKRLKKHKPSKKSKGKRTRKL
jgi:hypothetical protein